MFKFHSAFTIAFLLIHSACATIIRVPSQYPTIQAGIDAAVNGDTVLIADGIYTGLGNKNLDFAGRAILVVSENGPHSCIIDCEQMGRGFYFHSGETANSIVDGFTITRGWDPLGAGINCASSSPTIIRCIISYCRYPGGYGGGIYVSGGSPHILNCTIYGNDVPGGRGGGIYFTASNLVINSCILNNNSAEGG